MKEWKKSFDSLLAYRLELVKGRFRIYIYIGLIIALSSIVVLIVLDTRKMALLEFRFESTNVVSHGSL